MQYGEGDDHHHHPADEVGTPFNCPFGGDVCTNDIADGVGEAVIPTYLIVNDKDDQGEWDIHQHQEILHGISFYQVEASTKDHGGQDKVADAYVDNSSINSNDEH